MKRYVSLGLVLLVLAACGGPSHKITYSGHEENTVGVPGFDRNGKRLAASIKLGQSYTVDGETYTPKYDPDYVEEGMASWYGPGFHGGKTANGERFDKNDMTAAHRTLPLPSIVRVTMLETGKSTFVRVNDRGPFARGRIIDLSRKAAEQIGLIGKGVAKVRVEYMPAESQRFADLLAEGRDPKSIDVASEVLGQTTQYASAAPAYVKPVASAQPAQSSWKERLSPISNAHASEPETTPDDVQQIEEDDTVEPTTATAAPLSDISSSDISAPQSSVVVQRAGQAAYVQPPAPVAPAASAALAPSAAPAPTYKVVPKPMQVASLTPAPASAPANAPAAVVLPAEQVASGQFIQLGAFQQQANAERLRTQYASAGNVFVQTLPAPTGGSLYHVRMGPFSNSDQSVAMIDHLRQMGVDAKFVRE